MEARRQRREEDTENLVSYEGTRIRTVHPESAMNPSSHTVEFPINRSPRDEGSDVNSSVPNRELSVDRLLSLPASHTNAIALANRPSHGAQQSVNRTSYDAQQNDANRSPREKETNTNQLSHYREPSVSRSPRCNVPTSNHSPTIMNRGRSPSGRQGMTSTASDFIPLQDTSSGRSVIQTFLSPRSGGKGKGREAVASSSMSSSSLSSPPPSSSSEGEPSPTGRTRPSLLHREESRRIGCPALPPRRTPCKVCGGLAPERKLMVCRGCRQCVHTDCYGEVSRERAPIVWICDPCRNVRDGDKRGVRMYKPGCCCLCPISEGSNNAMKRTVGYNWAHILCATFVAEACFRDADGVDLVDGVPEVPTSRWEAACAVCGRSAGATVKCKEPECHIEFHVTCAEQAGYRLGFEVERADVAEHGYDFGDGRTGAMTAWARCPQHSEAPSENFVALSARDLVRGDSAVYCYIRTRKQFDFRKSEVIRARRYRQLPATVSGADSANQPNELSGASAENVKQQRLTERSCDRCQRKFSPIWWPADDTVFSSSKGSGTARRLAFVSRGPVICQTCKWFGTASTQLPSTVFAQMKAESDGDFTMIDAESESLSTASERTPGKKRKASEDAAAPRKRQTVKIEDGPHEDLSTISESVSRRRRKASRDAATPRNRHGVKIEIDPHEGPSIAPERLSERKRKASEDATSPKKRQAVKVELIMTPSVPTPPAIASGHNAAECERLSTDAERMIATVDYDTVIGKGCEHQS